MEKKKRKPNGYWTYEKCKEVALEYNNKKEIGEKNNSAYSIIRKNNWFELIEHFVDETKPRDYWTYEKCKEVALECKTFKELKEKYKGANDKIWKNNWSDLTSHFIRFKKPFGYWTYEKCEEVVNSCTTSKEMEDNYKSVYTAIMRNKWGSLLHKLEKSIKPRGYWTYDNCKIEADKYNTIKELKDNNKTVYNVIIKNKWYNIIKHYKRSSNSNKRMVYVYEFSDNHCYVGLTDDIKRRNREHRYKTGIICKYSIKTGLEPKLIIKTDYIDEIDAALLEGDILKEYINNGWIELNTNKTGGLGGKMKWTKELCIEEVKKYVYYLDFMNNSSGAYYSSLRNNWLDEITINLKRRKTKKGTLEQGKLFIRSS